MCVCNDMAVRFLNKIWYIDWQPALAGTGRLSLRTNNTVCDAADWPGGEAVFWGA